MSTGRASNDADGQETRPSIPRPMLLPLSSMKPVGSRVSAQLVLTVVQLDGQIHLFLEGYPYFSAYRNGFEFDDEQNDVASALAPSTARLAYWMGSSRARSVPWPRTSSRHVRQLR